MQIEIDGEIVTLGDDEVIPDRGKLYVRTMMRDSLTDIQRAVLFGDQQPVLDAYEQFQADRNAWRQKQAAELAAIIDGTGTPAFAAALVKREDAWQKRGEDQAKAWQDRPSAAASTAPVLQASASLADATAARDAAWQKRGEDQANAWRR